MCNAIGSNLQLPSPPGRMAAIIDADATVQVRGVLSVKVRFRAFAVDKIALSTQHHHEHQKSECQGDG